MPHFCIYINNSIIYLIFVANEKQCIDLLKLINEFKNNLLANYLFQQSFKLCKKSFIKLAY